MPELAEVQTVREVLKKQILNKKIKDIKILYDRIIENDLNFFKDSLINNKFIDIKRRGKYLIFETENNYLISHLRMEGKYFIKDHEDKIEKHEHIIFYFDDFTLRYHDTRKFGRMKLINKDEIDNYFKDLGPDANTYKDYDKLYKIIKNKKLPIKSILLDQSILAGLGNIYVDEVLFASNINPLKIGMNITKEEVKNILESSNKILEKAIIEKGCTIRSYTSSLGVKGNYQNFLMVHTKEGLPCPMCNTIIEKTRVGGRGTYFCPKCQK